MNTIELTIAAGLVFADARKHDLPDPLSVRIADESVDIQIRGVAALAQWAQWAEATITASDPEQYDDQRWIVWHRATGAVHDLPVALCAIEWGVMLDPDSFECASCGAKFGTTAGFVADGAYDDAFEIEVARHQDGHCTPVSVQ